MRCTVTLFCLFVSILLSAQMRPELDTLVRRMAARNYVTGSLIVTGLYSGPLRYDPQYEDYERLLPLLREGDVWQLFQHDSLAVASFAFKAATDRFPRLVVPLLRTEAACPRAGTFRHFLNTCQGDTHPTLKEFMLGEIWLKLKTEKLALTADEMSTYQTIRNSLYTQPRPGAKTLPGKF